MGLSKFIREGITHLNWRYVQLRYRLNDGTVTRTVGGETVTFGVDSFREYLRLIDYQGEDSVIEWLLTNIQSGDVFWDVGANIGTHSCYVGQKTDQVVAVEPHPENAKRARDHLRQNKVRGTVVEVALGETTKQVHLRVPSTDSSETGVGTFTIQKSPELKDVVETTLVPGDKLVEDRNLPLPDVIKIDVEGAEMGVLKGFQKGLSNAHTVLVEVHPKHAATEDVVETLESVGYSVSVLDQRNGEIHVFAKK